MIAVVVLPGPAPAMLGLDARRPAALLPLGDRPFLQHLLEFLVGQGIHSVHILAAHGPESVERLLGSGDRWGCRLRYHLVRDPAFPYRSLRVIPETEAEPWLLVHAVRFPYAELAPPSLDRPVAFCMPPSGGGGWGECTLFPPGGWNLRLAELSPQQLAQRMQTWLREGAAEAETPAEWVDISTPGRLLDCQARLLTKSLRLLRMGGIEREKGVWISRNVVIDPAAELVPPLYIGPHSRIGRGVRLGPQTVIAGTCMIDSDTVVERSLILAGTYVGTALDLRDSVVDRQLLVNVAHGTGVDVRENFLLGGLSHQYHRSWLARGLSSLAAAVLLLLLLPATLLAVGFYALFRRRTLTTIRVPVAPLRHHASQSPAQFALPCLGADAWAVHRPASWSAVCRQILPGLWSVLLGHVALVGLPPRTVQQLAELEPEWQRLYEESRIGLISEASVVAGTDDEPTQFYLCDAYYVAQRGLRHDLGLVWRYAQRLLAPGRREAS